MEYTGGLSLGDLQRGARLPDAAKMLWEKEETPITQQEFNLFMTNWLSAKRQEPVSEAAKPMWENFTKQGLGDGQNPQGFLKREELAVVLSRGIFITRD